MATWLVHLRVADKIFDSMDIRDGSLFFAGSIAPDADNLPDTSHRCKNGDKTTCDADGFYKEYLRGKTETPLFDFYTGYYIHLLTDVLWHTQKIEPLKHRSKDEIKTVKQAWRSVDQAFLFENPAFRPINMLAEATTDPAQKTVTADTVKAFIEGIAKYKVTEPVRAEAGVQNEIEQFVGECAAFILAKLNEEVI